MVSDLVPFTINLFFYYCKHKWIWKTKKKIPYISSNIYLLKRLYIKYILQNFMSKKNAPPFEVSDTTFNLDLHGESVCHIYQITCFLHIPCLESVGKFLLFKLGENFTFIPHLSYIRLMKRFIHFP